jgi:hypothetical protein
MRHYVIFDMNSLAAFEALRFSILGGMLCNRFDYRMMKAEVRDG